MHGPTGLSLNLHRWTIFDVRFQNKSLNLVALEYSWLVYKWIQEIPQIRKSFHSFFYSVLSVYYNISLKYYITYLIQYTLLHVKYFFYTIYIILSDKKLHVFNIRWLH